MFQISVKFRESVITGLWNDYDWKFAVRESGERLKSLLSSLYKREEFPLFDKEGIEEIFAAMCLFNYGFLSGA